MCLSFLPIRAQLVPRVLLEWRALLDLLVHQGQWYEPRHCRFTRTNQTCIGNKIHTWHLWLVAFDTQSMTDKLPSNHCNHPEWFLPANTRAAALSFTDELTKSAPFLSLSSQNPPVFRYAVGDISGVMHLLPSPTLPTDCLHVFHLANLWIHPPPVTGAPTSCPACGLVDWWILVWASEALFGCRSAVFYRDLPARALRELGNPWVLSLSSKWPHLSWVLDSWCGEGLNFGLSSAWLFVWTRLILQCPASCPAGPQGMPGLPGMKVRNHAVLILLYCSV